ncbi:hypothetical protein [Halomonas sp. H10-9-1]|uniref:hypothetical protein n=1 Tax=Halomonas sp. H10-9-1 TaxID=2950871 RepID=UPI0032E02849
MKRPRTPSGTGKGVFNDWLGGELVDRPLGQVLLTLAITLPAIPLLLQLITAVLQRPYAIYLEANSETLELTTQGNVSASWYLADARILHRVAPTSPRQDMPPSLPDGFVAVPTAAPPGQPQEFQGCLEIGPHARVTLRRQGKGPLHIDIEGVAVDGPAPSPPVVLRPLTGAAAGAGQQCAEQTGVEALARLTLEATPGDTPLNGTLRGVGRLGGSPYFANLAESPPLLRNGRAVIMGRRLLSERAYTLQEAPLYLGDVVRVTRSAAAKDDRKPADQPPHGALLTCLFAVEGEKGPGGIELACHANGQALNIQRYGDRSREDLAPRPWDVLINEPLIQATLPTAVVGLMALVLLLLDPLYPRLCRRLRRTRDAMRRRD